jgi:murein DD-endopeptidase MepM/ murein hydrolase activator NlpD
MKKIPALISQLPKRHLITLSALISCLLLGLVFLPASQVEAKRSPIPLAINLDKTETEPQLSTQNETDDADWLSLEVEPGDNLSKLFQRAELPASQLFTLIESNPDSKALTKLLPGEKISLQTQGKQLIALKYSPSKLKTTVFMRNETGFETQTIERSPEIRTQYIEASLNSSLFLAAQKAGLPQNLIMEMAGIFSGVMDFVYDPRQGDTFSLLFEEKYLDDEKLGYGNILAATYNNAGEVHTAYRYSDHKGNSGYYSESGVSMTKAFLRAPLDFTRISSGFNPRRLHPVFKTTRPHRGVDYAASRGTPVYAAGDGRVTRAGYSKANGNYVIINHGTQYVTKYLHLNKRYVKTGQRVSQKQTIGTVGSTGYATGPHLHYEFLVNGIHRNPRTIFNKLPKAKSIRNEEQDTFKEQISALHMQLTKYQQDFQLASLTER